MTVSSEIPKSGPYAGDGANTVFARTFYIASDAELVIIETDSDGVETVVSSGFTIADAGLDEGDVTFDTAPADGNLITMYRVTALSQLVELTNQGGLFLDTIEDALDKITRILQDHQERIDRAVVVDVSGSDDPATLIDDLEAQTDAATLSASEASTSAAAAAVSAAEAAASALLAQPQYYMSAADDGAVNAHQITVQPDFTALSQGMVFSFYPVATNTSTTPTLDIYSASLPGGTGAKTITKHGGQPLEAGDIKIGQPAIMSYDGTDLELITAPSTTIFSTQGPISSGTEVDFTSIPSDVKRMVLSIYAHSFSGAAELALVLGDSGGFETTGYNGAVDNAASPTAWSAAAALTAGALAADVIHGQVELTTVGGNRWLIKGQTADAGGARVNTFVGSKELSAALTQIRLNGGTFDGGGYYSLQLMR